MHKQRHLDFLANSDTGGFYFYCYIQDYAWIKAGMVFPYHEYMDRFQGRTKLYGSKASDLQMAIEEAILAENGFTNPSVETVQEALPETKSSEIEQATGSNQKSQHYFIEQVSFHEAQFLLLNMNNIYI
ncbi:histone-lysine N-methyltransferase ATX3-like [Olea europaea var. sylvestris]|uniref:histone-lysine N-methyltransferase ATX3-like n=1 Tax=Olea europaea var. sylvestris TaxID=158386 RepID=UPI000C1D512B|nr:histone-lysine N-methyltransferase ATX3-like [Olea europaea var. sylvestris]